MWQFLGVTEVEERQVDSLIRSFRRTIHRPSHGRGRRFKSYIAHQRNKPATCGNAEWRVSLCRPKRAVTPLSDTITAETGLWAPRRFGVSEAWDADGLLAFGGAGVGVWQGWVSRAAVR